VKKIVSVQLFSLGEGRRQQGDACHQKPQGDDKGCGKGLSGKLSDGEGAAPEHRRYKQGNFRKSRPFHFPERLLKSLSCHCSAPGTK